MSDPETLEAARRERASAPPPPPEPMPLLEGIGSLVIAAGVLAALGTITSPDMLWTFASIAVVAITGGVLVVSASRASTRRRASRPK